MPDETSLLQSLNDQMIRLNASLDTISELVRKHDAVLYGVKGDDGLTYDVRDLKTWKEITERQNEEHKKDFKGLVLPLISDLIKMVGTALFTLFVASKFWSVP